MIPGLILVAIMIGALVGAVYISRWLVKRGMRHVVLAFRERGATDYEHAVTAQELGVVRGRLYDRMFKIRDYKPDALNILLQADVVQMTEEGRLYLSEENLAHSNAKAFIDGATEIR